MPQDLRYPIGKFQRPETITPEIRAQWIADIRALPAKIRSAVTGLTDAQLDTPYRPDGWTIRQVVHHVPDSHMNSYVRFKWALTEDAPAIKAYDEAAWAELPDAKTAPIDVSLNLLDALHARWANMLDALTPEQLRRTFVHPELGPVPLDSAIGGYAHHGNHHLAHITSLKERMEW